MILELQLLQRTIWAPLDLEISDPLLDKEASEYMGCDFLVNGLHVKFRKARITPKKTGLFVTLWQRDSKGKTIPFHQNHSTELYIIMAQQSEKDGFFIFPKQALVLANILSTDHKEGKRGFRLYTPWDTTNNGQAMKTQQWQSNYFFETDLPVDKMIARLKAILPS